MSHNPAQTTPITISQLIAKLQEIKEAEGDINVCISEPHTVYGREHVHLRNYHMVVKEAKIEDINFSKKTEKCLIFDF